MSQANRVLDWLESGKTITTLDSFRDLGITRLAARIYGLRADGYFIRTTMLTRNGKRYASYSL